MIEIRMIELSPTGHTLFAQRKLIYSLAAPHPVCAEIGVFTGRNSEFILAQMQPKELHLIDPWQLVDNIPDYPAPVKTNEKMAEIHASVVAKFRDNPNVHVTKGFSIDVVHKFPDGYFDFVYIDGNHAYEDALEDLEAWLPKLKPTGVFAGDDFDTYSVASAVMHFCETHGFRLYGTFSRGFGGNQFLIDYNERFDLDYTVKLAINDCHDDLEYIKERVAHLPERTTEEYEAFLKHLLGIEHDLRQTNKRHAAEIKVLREAIAGLHSLLDQQRSSYAELLRQHLIATGVLKEDSN